MFLLSHSPCISEILTFSLPISSSCAYTQLWGSLCDGQEEARHKLFASAATDKETWSTWTSFTDVSHLQVNLALNLTKKHACNQEQLASTCWWKHWEKIRCPVADVSWRTVTLLSFPSKSWGSAMMTTSTLFMQQLKQKTRQLPAWAMH